MQIFFGITIKSVSIILFSASFSYIIAISYVYLNSKFEEKVLKIRKTKQKVKDKPYAPIYDTLTKLPTREYLEDHFDEILANNSKDSEVLSFAMIDLDRFKQINDTKGHQGGDAVLKSAVDSEGTVVRYAGDEFCVIFPNKKVTEAKKIIEGVAENLANHEFKNLEHVLRPTLSVGISEFPTQTKDKGELIGFADQALYISKNLGRNSITLFGEDVFVEQALELECWIELQSFLTVNGKVRADSWRLHPDSEQIEVVTLFEYTSMIPYVSNTAHEATEQKTYKTSFLGKVLKISSMSPNRTEFVLLVQKADLPIKVKEHLSIE